MNQVVQHPECNCHECTQARWLLSFQYQLSGLIWSSQTKDHTEPVVELEAEKTPVRGPNRHDQSESIISEAYADGKSEPEPLVAAELPLRPRLLDCDVIDLNQPLYDGRETDDYMNEIERQLNAYRSTLASLQSAPPPEPIPEEKK